GTNVAIIEPWRLLGEAFLLCLFQAALHRFDCGLVLVEPKFSLRNHGSFDDPHFCPVNLLNNKGLVREFRAERNPPLVVGSLSDHAFFPSDTSWLPARLAKVGKWSSG